MFKRLSLMFLAVALPVHAATLIANSYGAKGDGIADDTRAIQKALDAAAGKHDTLTLNPGVNRIGSIFVKSGSRLDLPKGVTLRGIQSLDVYPLMPTRIAGIEMTWPAALVTGFLYNVVAVRTRSLPACVAAHAVTNALLGGYVMYTHQWGFW